LIECSWVVVAISNFKRHLKLKLLSGNSIFRRTFPFIIPICGAPSLGPDCTSQKKERAVDTPPPYNLLPFNDQRQKTHFPSFRTNSRTTPRLLFFLVISLRESQHGLLLDTVLYTLAVPLYNPFIASPYSAGLAGLSHSDISLRKHALFAPIIATILDLLAFIYVLTDQQRADNYLGLKLLSCINHNN
jgi:hypothetical protein